MKPSLRGWPAFRTPRCPRVVGPGTDLVHLWSELVPRLGVAAAAPGDDPEARRWRVFEAVAGLVRSIAGERPLLLIVDDLQWAEPSTLLLLGHLTRRAVPGFALVATVRYGESAKDADGLLGDLGDGRSIDIIDLVGLDDTEVAELVAVRTGDAPPDYLSAQLRQHTDGNPFFLASLLTHLEEVAFVRSTAGEWVTAAELDAAGVPQSVRGVIARRVAPLDPFARRALDVAAVGGHLFDERIIRGVLDSSLAETVDALEAMMGGGIIREDDTGHFTFSHALIRHAVLDAMSRTRRASLHWRVAEQLEYHNPSHLGEIAHHYLSGREAGDEATVARTSLAAGEDALHRVAFDEAVGHLRTALGALDRTEPDLDTQYRILTCLGRALNALAEPGEAQQLWLEAADIARHERSPEQLFAALQGYGYTMRLSADPELVRLVDDLLEMIGPADSALPRARSAGGPFQPRPKGEWRAWPSQDDVRMANEAVDMARRIGDAYALISTLHSRLLLEALAPDTTTMLRDAEEVVALVADAAPATWDHSFSLRFLTLALLRLGRRAEADRHLASAVQKAEESGLRMALHNTLQLRSALATASGQFTESKRFAAEAAQRAGRHIMLVELGYVGQILAGRLEQGRLDAVIAGLRGLDGLDVDLPAWQAMLVGVLADLGHHHDARVALDQLEASTTSVTDGARSGTPIAIRHLSEAYRQLGDSKRSAVLLEQVRPWAGQILVGPWGLSIEGASDRAIGHLLATLGRLDEADEAYTSAAELEQSANFPPLVARTHYWHAAALLERDAPSDRQRARALLERVIEITDRNGMVLLCRQARQSRDHEVVSTLGEPSARHHPTAR